MHAGWCDSSHGGCSHWPQCYSIQSLVSAGADMNIQDKVIYYIPHPEAHTAAHVTLLLLQYGHSALVWALQGGNLEASEILIKAGAGLSHQESVMHYDCIALCVTLQRYNNNIYAVVLCRLLAGHRCFLRQ